MGFYIPCTCIVDTENNKSKKEGERKYNARFFSEAGGVGGVQTQVETWASGPVRGLECYDVSRAARAASLPVNADDL